MIQWPRMTEQATELVLLASEDHMRDIGKKLNCTPRQCRQHLLGAARSDPDRVIKLVRGTVSEDAEHG